MLQFAVYTAPGGTLIEDYSSRIQKPMLATNERGFAEASGFVPMGIDEAFRIYDRTGLPHVVFSDSAAGPIYEGRLEDVNITGDGVELRAFGYQRSLSDSPYTALWSDTRTSSWRVLTTSDNAAIPSERYESDTNNRLFLAARKGETFSNAIIGLIAFVIPSNSSRQIVGISFDYVFHAPNTNWQLLAERRNPSGWGVSGTDVTVIDTAGLGVGGSLNFTFTGTDAYTVGLYYNAAAAVFAGDTGTCYFKITNVRVVTSTANRVNTTLTANRNAGTNVTATVGSTARMYVGQLLNVGPSPNAESVTVLSIGSSTQFNATFAQNYVIGNTVQAHVIYADEIAKDMRAAASTLNGAQLASSDVLIQSPARDLLNELYEDQYPADILDRLITLGDNQTPPRQWEWGVQTGRLLLYRPQSSVARIWYIDVSDLEVQRSLDDLANSVYATYQEASGRTLRTAVAADTTSVLRYGITRRRQIDADTTSTTQANAQRDAALQDSKDPKPRSGVTIRNVYDGNGTRWPLCTPQAGDTMIIRNLPPTLSSALDRIRIFRLTRTEYHADDDTLTIEPESPLPSLDAMLALAVPPAWVTVPWWVQIRKQLGLE